MIYVIYMHMREVNAQFMVMSRYRVVVLSADAVERLREKIIAHHRNELRSGNEMLTGKQSEKLTLHKGSLL